MRDYFETIAKLLLIGDIKKCLLWLKLRMSQMKTIFFETEGQPSCFLVHLRSIDCLSDNKRMCTVTSF